MSHWPPNQPSTILEWLQQPLCRFLTAFGFFHSCRGPESRTNLEVVKSAWITPCHYVLFMASSSLLLCCISIFLTYYSIPKYLAEYDRAAATVAHDAVTRDWIKTQIDGLATSTIPRCLAEYDKVRNTAATDAVTRHWIKTQIDGLATSVAIAEFNGRIISISNILHAHKKEMNQTILGSVDQIRQVMQETLRECLGSPPPEFLTFPTYKDGLATLQEQLRKILHELANESARTTGLSKQLSSFLTPPIGMEDYPSTIQDLFNSTKNDILAVNGAVRAVQNSLEKDMPHMTKTDDLEIIKQTLRAILGQVQEEEKSSVRMTMGWETFLLRLGEITKQLTAAQDLLDSSARNLSEIKTETGTIHLRLTEHENTMAQIVDDCRKQLTDSSNVMRANNTPNTKQAIPIHQPSTADLSPQSPSDSIASQLYLINNGLRALVKRQEENDVAATMKLIGDVRLESEHSPASDVMESVVGSHGSTPLRCDIHIKIGDKSFAEAVQWAMFGAPIAPLKNLAEDIILFRKFSENIEKMMKKSVSEE
ncbi:hypothetical protein EG328_004058 [Venturia inaequalis]|uniref:Uncharacterized protein n=1 Tax=Venturia inaequalis TaxID=5025 RepID=A0A8H3YW39_VENIN|nr:hypothetical protein EG328_004058 [Venturia inaequalis]